jgi:hypothetical protein
MACSWGLLVLVFVVFAVIRSARYWLTASNETGFMI